MTQIPVFTGTFESRANDIDTFYPKNFLQIYEPSGVSNGYLRQCEGIAPVLTGPGIDRGGTVWNGVHYRVMGTKLVSIVGTVVTVIGDVGGSGRVTFAFSFDRMAVASSERLYYYRNNVLSLVTDPDLGPVKDMIWFDGYFVTTDGENIVVTELNDPAAVDPLKYGSSEADPDPIKGLIAGRGEIYVINQYTIEVFQNIGGTGFPFGRVRGAQIAKGALSAMTKTSFLDTFAFVGRGRVDDGVDPPAVYLAGAGQAIKVRCAALEKAMDALEESQLANIMLESRSARGRSELLIHLPDETWVYSYTTSQSVDDPAWHRLSSGAFVDRAYRGRNWLRHDGKWYCGDTDTAQIGVMGEAISTQFGEVAGAEFRTSVLYGEGRGAILHMLELSVLAGRAAFGQQGTAFLSFSDDGYLFGQERSASYGGYGQRGQRLTWMRCGMFRNERLARFRIQNTVPASFQRLEGQFEALNA